MATIGIDYTAAYQQGAGIGRYVRELVHALANLETPHVYRLFVSGARNPDQLPVLPSTAYTWKTTRISPQWMARIWHRARLPLPVELWTGALDLYHATDFVLPPTRSETRALLTVHDLSFIRVPETASPTLRNYLEQVVPRSVSQADHILADSNATKQDLIKYYETPAEKITVLLSGVDKRFKRVIDPVTMQATRQKYNLGDWPFLFTIGTVQPRKNYARLCEALHILHTQHPDLHLVIAGGKGWLEDPIYAAIQELQLGDMVHFTGFVDDADLPSLYSSAEVVPFVSLYEGFGLPVLEAMACGTPVVTSNLSSLPEVGGKAASLVDPYDPEAVADATHGLLANSARRKQAIERGYEQAARFTWHRSAQTLLRTYEMLLSSRGL